MLDAVLLVELGKFIAVKEAALSVTSFWGNTWFAKIMQCFSIVLAYVVDVITSTSIYFG